MRVFLCFSPKPSPLESTPHSVYNYIYCMVVVSGDSDSALTASVNCFPRGGEGDSS